MSNLRLAARSLRQSPAFTLIAVLSLALGIGAATSVYSLTFALFFAPPAGAADPERLVRICRLVNGRPEGHELSYADYLDFRDHATVFSELASDGNVTMLTDTERGEQLLTVVVSPSYFGVLGLRPHQGRFFLASEDTPAGRDLVVVLSHAFWQKRFAGNTRVVGARFVLDDMPYTIVGVAPAGFDGSSAGWTPDIFVPNRTAFTDAALANRATRQVDLIGRLKSGRTLADAQAEMMLIARQLEQAHPETTRDLGLVVSKLRGLDPEARSSEARLPLVLVATVACLLTIACVNLAGLLLARHAARRKEIAIRLALGAGRGRVVHQLLTESLLLSTLGGAAGLVVASWGKTLLERGYAREMFDGARHLYPLTLDMSAYLLTLSIATATGIAFGLLPALQASRPVLVPALKGDVAAPRRSRLRTTFLVMQVALSVVLLVGAALAIQSTRTVWHDPGFDPEHIAYFNLAPGRAGYRAEKATLYKAEVRRRLESLAFVQSMSFVWIPLPLWGSTADVFLPGQPPARPEDALKVPVNWVAARFFETLRIPILSGRDIEMRDIELARPTVVVNEALARRFGIEQDAVGRTLMVGGKPFEVLGIARYQGLRAQGDTARPYLFCSDPGRRDDGSLMVRVNGDVEAALPALRGEILAVDAHVPIRQAMSLTRVLANQEAEVPIAMGVLSFAGGLALLLTMLGLYGVVAGSVEQRTREIGIRIALGARSAAIVGLVLREGLRLVVIGLPLGLATSLASVRLLAHYLYGVSATDAGTFIVIAGLLAAVTVAACYVPARRAMRVEPLQALRHD